MSRQETVPAAAAVLATPGPRPDRLLEVFDNQSLGLVDRELIEEWPVRDWEVNAGPIVAAVRRAIVARHPDNP